MVEPEPVLIESIANINIVYYVGKFFAVPQQLGRIFLEDYVDTPPPSGVTVWSSHDAARRTVTWRNYVMWPLWRLSIVLRDISFRIVGFEPQVRQKASERSTKA